MSPRTDRSRPQQFGMLLLAAMVSLLPACQKPQEPAAAPSQAGGAPAAPAASPGGPITQEDAEAFADELEQAIEADDLDGLLRLFDFDALVDRALTGLELTPKSRTDIRLGMIAGLRKSAELQRKILEEVRAGATYETLRIHEQDGGRRVLVRMLSDGGLNYHDYVLTKRPGGRAQAADVFVYFSGELVSTSMRRAMLPLAVQQSRNLIDRLTRSESDYVKHQSAILKVIQTSNNGPHDETLRLFDTLPESVKTDKNLLLARIRAAQNIGDDALYAAAIEDFRRAHPDDVAVDIISLDYYVLRNQTKPAMAAIDRLDEQVGGDPYLDVFRAGIAVQAENFPLAREAAERAVKNLPDLRAPLDTLLDIVLHDEDHKATLAVLTKLRDRFGVTFKDLREVPPFEKFVASPQFQTWLESQPATPGP